MHIPFLKTKGLCLFGGNNVSCFIARNRREEAGVDRFVFWKSYARGEKEDGDDDDEKNGTRRQVKVILATILATKPPKICLKENECHIHNICRLSRVFPGKPVFSSVFFSLQFSLEFSQLLLHLCNVRFFLFWRRECSKNGYMLKMCKINGS